MIKYGKIFIIHKYDTISFYDYYIGNPIYEFEYSINESTNIIIVFEKENSNDNNIYDNLQIKNIIKTNANISKSVESIDEKLEIPKYLIVNNNKIIAAKPFLDINNNYSLNFNKFFYLDKTYNIKEAIESKFNCIFKYEDKEVFSILMKKSSVSNPIFHFGYDSELFTEIDIIKTIYLVLVK